jgi:hypothetical protein
MYLYSENCILCGLHYLDKIGGFVDCEPQAMASAQKRRHREAVL